MKAFFSVLFFLVFLCTFVSTSFAQYTLPYPGVMPGNKFYALYEAVDFLKKHFAFGDFASFSHNMSQADKYLVEAKTLFEYGQYPLALEALKKSNSCITETKNSLKKAKVHQKDISEKENIFTSALLKHIETLESTMKVIPSQFLWKAENKEPLMLFLEKEILQAINHRRTL